MYRALRAKIIAVKYTLGVDKHLLVPGFGGRSFATVTNLTNRTERMAGANLLFLYKYFSSKSKTQCIYEGKNTPVVELYTKEGCSLCDDAQDILMSVMVHHPHTLRLVDITDAGKEEMKNAYQFDIPVIYIDGVYWAKHRITSRQAQRAIEEASAGSFKPRHGEPAGSPG